MAPGTTLRDPLSLGLRSVILLPLLPVVVLILVVMAIEEGTRPWEYALIALLFGGIVACAMRMYAFITLRADAVRLGFMPFYWRTIPYRDIATVEAVEIDPMRDYRGWGIKGRSTRPKGMLFSGGSRWGIRITLRDGRRYIATSSEPVDDFVAELQARLPQSVSHSHDAPSTISCHDT